MIDDLTKDINKALDHRGECLRMTTPCPVCNTDQVQLVSCHKDPVWKCRHCKFIWTKELNNKGDNNDNF